MNKLESILTSFPEKRQKLVLEILEVLSLAEEPNGISTTAAKEIFDNTRKESLKQAQSLFNDLKESFISDEPAEAYVSWEGSALSSNEAVSPKVSDEPSEDEFAEMEDDF